MGQYLKLSSNYTPHCRLFPENLTDMQLVKKSVAFCGTQMLITVLTKPINEPHSGPTELRPNLHTLFLQSPF
jgi:hypothetical protein